MTYPTRTCVHRPALSHARLPRAPPHCPALAPCLAGSGGVEAGLLQCRLRVEPDVEGGIPAHRRAAPPPPPPRPPAAADATHTRTPFIPSTRTRSSSRGPASTDTINATTSGSP